MMTKLFVVVAALCVGVAMAGTATYDIDVINTYPSSDGATFTLAGTEAVTALAYKGTGSKSVTLDDSAGTTAVIKIGDGTPNTINLSQAQVAGLVAAGDAWAALTTYKAVVGGSDMPVYGIGPLPKAAVVTTAMYTQFANTALTTLATYPTVTVAYMYTVTTSAGGVSVTTPFVNSYRTSSQGSFLTVPMIIIDAKVANADSVTNEVKIKVIAGSQTITTQSGFDSATALFQSGAIPFKAGMATCVMSGDCGANNFESCSTGDYPLALTCDKVNWSGVAALKPTMVFALLAAAIAMFFAW